MTEANVVNKSAGLGVVGGGPYAAGVSTWPPISRDDLRTAASSAGFDTVLPLLLRRLIAETADGLEALDMPGGSGVAAGGFDGVVRASRPSTFVPGGTSIWELSVGGGQTKANDDYVKRHEAPDGLPTGDVTYVEAILDTWTKARSWAKDRTQEGRWREVRAYNLDRIHVWLDQAPATTSWLASQIGKAMPGVRSVVAWWSDSWLRSTRVPLDRSIVLAGREKSAEALIAALSMGQSVISLGGDLRVDEACAFCAAAVENAATVDREAIGSRVLYVSDPTSLEQLLAQKQPLILLLADLSIARGLLSSSHPHQVIVLAAPGGPSDITVPRIDGQTIAAQLKSEEIEYDEAARLGVVARRSLLALQRALANHPVLHTPKWVSSPDSVMRRMLLLGSWSERVNDDRRIVGVCTGMPYEQVQLRAEQLASVDDIPFLNRVDDVWYVVAFEDTWTMLATSIAGDDLAAFREVAVEVLGEADPVLELESDQRWKAGLTGIKRKFSRDLRRGLAETLALMGTSDTLVQGAGGRTLSEFATLMVRDLLDGASNGGSYKGWLSLVDVLGDLAEAAPREFLDAMRVGFTGERPAHLEMFQDAEVDRFGFGPSSPHTYFLEALERVAWSADYIDEATDILARLAAIDPGGRWSNRPITSLVEILSAWSPNTSGSAEDQIRCIRNIADRYPEVGQRLLLALIPDGNELQAVHPGPRFRDWKRQVARSHQEISAVISEVTALLIKNLGNDPERLSSAIEKLDDVSLEHRKAMCQQLVSLSTSLDEKDKGKLYEALRGQLARHREYSDSAWSLSEIELQPIEIACDALTPSDPVLRHVWLFSSDWVTLGDVKRRDDYSAYEAEMRERRAGAISEVVQSDGLDAVLVLANTTDYRGIVGASLADYSVEYDQTIIEWLARDEEPAGTVAAGYFRVRLSREGGSLCDSLLAASSVPSVKAAILRLYNDPPAAWEKMKSLDSEVNRLYWNQFVYFGLGQDFSNVLEAAWSLLDVGRAAAALDLMVIYLRRGPQDEASAELVATAMEMLITAGAEDPELARLDQYHFEQLFALLSENRELLGNQRVVALEWQLYPITGLKANAPSLHRALVEDPEFFKALMTMCFKTDTPVPHEGENEGGATRDRATVVRAYEVLRSCPLCPGVMVDVQLDTVALQHWVRTARSGLTVVDRLHIGDLHIGELLANAPVSADGSPLHEGVRDLLEELRSDEIERGIETGIRNARGVTSRGVYEGGAQEWALANDYRTYAESAKPWPRTRRIFQDLVSSFEAHARRLDTEAERRRQGLEL